MSSAAARDPTRRSRKARNWRWLPARRWTVDSAASLTGSMIPAPRRSVPPRGTDDRASAGAAAARALALGTAGAARLGRFGHGSSLSLLLTHEGPDPYSRPARVASGPPSAARP